ncbi:serine hydrolase [Variovorax paradoxus]|nr:serine hydrolase [Variovorax paradoxus]
MLSRRHLMAALLLVGTSATGRSQSSKDARDGWQLSSPSDQGLDKAMLDELARELASERKSVRSVVVVRHGRLAFEYYREGLGPSSLHDMRTATMSVMSTLVGVAIHNGLIKNVDQPISEFLPEATGEGVDSRVRAMTLEHLLTLTAGFDPDVKQIGRWAFPVEFALRRPLVSDSGAKFSFDVGTAHLVARVLVSATQQNVLQFAQKQLFGPLGIRRYLWQIDRPGGGELGYGGLQLTARDMAKLGQLQLQRGAWNGVALMSPAYVEAATRKQSSGGPPVHWAYGYSWWIAPSARSPAPFMAGADDGQRIYVNPSMSLVVVVTSEAVRSRSRVQADADLVINDIVLRAAKR